MRSKLSITILDQLKQLDQSMHNLRNRFPIGISSIDNANDLKYKRLRRIKMDILLFHYKRLNNAV